MKTTFALALIISVSAAAWPQSGGPFTIQKSVVASSGGTVAGGGFTIAGTTGQALAGTTSSGGQFQLGSGFWGGGVMPITSHRTAFDFDGDGKTDLSIFRPAPAEWYYQKSSTGV